MDAALVEAVPASRPHFLAEPLEELPAAVADHVVLARRVVHVDLGPLENLIGRVELGGGREMRDIAGVQDQRRRFFHAGDLVEPRFAGCRPCRGRPPRRGSESRDGCR